MVGWPWTLNSFRIEKLRAGRPPPSHSTLYVVVETWLKVKREANGLVDLPTTYIEIRTTQSLNDEPEV